MDKYRILIVDDDPETSLILANYLSDHYESLVAANGLDALIKIGDVEPEIVIVDVMMPVMSGFEFVRRLRSSPRFESTLVVYLSARTEENVIRDGYETGADVYLTKPFDPETVRILLRNLIEDNEIQLHPKSRSLEDLEAMAQSRFASGEIREQPASFAKHARPRLLLVDDDPVIRELLTHSCSEDFEVLGAADGLEAVDQASIYKPDIFIVDYVLPQVSGAQVVKVLRSTHDFLNAPIFLISGRCDPADRASKEQLDISGAFAKPVDPEDLLGALREATASNRFRVHRHRPDLPLESSRAGRTRRPGYEGI